MKYLLDTHTLLWAVFEPDKLTEKVEKLIQDPTNQVFVSVISFWEISLKYNIGKLELINTSPETLPEIAEEMGIEILDVKSDEAASFYKLPRLAHKDPFDRMVIWQAVLRKMMLVSGDREFRQYRQYGLRLVW